MVAATLLVTQTLASPTPVEREAVTNIAVGQASSSAAISNSNQLAAAIESFSADFQSLSAAVSVGEAIFTQIVPAPVPTVVSQLQSELQEIITANPGDISESGAEILLNGLANGDYAQVAKGYLLESSSTNINLIPPSTTIYPKASPNDAPYSLSEAALREVIHIPLAFTYGRIPPVIFLPGTGAVAGQNFGPNFATLFAQKKIADPVYVNISGDNLADI